MAPVASFIRLLKLEGRLEQECEGMGEQRNKKIRPAREKCGDGLAEAGIEGGLPHFRGPQEERR